MEGKLVSLGAELLHAVGSGSVPCSCVFEPLIYYL